MSVSKSENVIIWSRPSLIPNVIVIFTSIEAVALAPKFSVLAGGGAVIGGTPWTRPDEFPATAAEYLNMNATAKEDLSTLHRDDLDFLKAHPELDAVANTSVIKFLKDHPDVVDFFKALRAGESKDRCAGRHKCDERSLQQHAADNPVSATLAFERTIRLMREVLIAIPNGKTTKPFHERPKGCFGIPLADLYVKESNSRQSQHVHQQLLTGNSPAYLTDIAHEEALRDALLKALETHVQCELPLEYHAAELTRDSLRVPKSRDAAFQPRRTSDELAHQSLQAASNHNTHVHCMTCTKGPRGSIGCRMCKPSPHGKSSTTLTQLHVIEEGDDIEDQYNTSPLYSGYNGFPQEDKSKFARPNRLPFRCPCCYAGGVLDKRPPLPLPERDAALLKRDGKRDIAYTVTLAVPKNTSQGPDERALALEFGRQLLPGDVIDDNDKLAAFVRDARTYGHAKVYCPDSDGDRQAIDQFSAILDDDQKFTKVLMRKGNAPLLAKLKGLLETSSETSSITTIRELLFVWSDPRNVCRNGLIADFSPLISSCLGCNNNPLNLGAGASSISVAMYQIKYMGKETTEIALASSVLVDAQKSIRDHPSVAEDSGSLGRNAMHFMQRILNSAESEMEATRAASIVLGLASSGAACCAHGGDALLIKWWMMLAHRSVMPHPSVSTHRSPQSVPHRWAGQQ